MDPDFIFSARVNSSSEVRVLVSKQDAIPAGILEAFIHPATTAAVVSVITVEKLLDRELGQFLGITRDHTQTLKGSCSTEGPAPTTAPLVERNSNFSLSIPVFVGRDISVIVTSFILLLWRWDYDSVSHWNSIIHAVQVLPQFSATCNFFRLSSGSCIAGILIHKLIVRHVSELVDLSCELRSSRSSLLIQHVVILDHLVLGFEDLVTSVELLL